jgi:dimeric dUTPase (all-alpha-NTP-PPase superfamily)
VDVRPDAAPEGTPTDPEADRLETIFRWQAAFQADLVARRGLDFDAATWIQKAALALIVELGEVLEEARYKWWKTNPPMDPDKLHEELVDVLHFFVTMCLAAGMTAEDLYQGYLAKNQENFRRQMGLSDRPDYQA